MKKRYCESPRYISQCIIGKDTRGGGEYCQKKKVKRTFPVKVSNSYKNIPVSNGDIKISVTFPVINVGSEV